MYEPRPEPVVALGVGSVGIHVCVVVCARRRDGHQGPVVPFVDGDQASPPGGHGIVGYLVLVERLEVEPLFLWVIVGGVIPFAGCGPSEDEDALGEGEPATKMSDEDRKKAEKLGIKFDPKPDVKTSPEEKK